MKIAIEGAPGYTPNAFMTQPDSAPTAPSKSFHVDALPVRVYAGASEMARDTARLARNYLQEVLARQGSAAVILATGNSQIESWASPRTIERVFSATCASGSKAE